MSNELPSDASSPEGARPQDLAEKARRYMAEFMAMTVPNEDQEQNWIFGHMVAFAHRLGALSPLQETTDPRLSAIREIVESLDERSLEDMKEARSVGAFAGDVSDAPDDCETTIIVTRGEMRELRKALAREARAETAGPRIAEIRAQAAACLHTQLAPIARQVIGADIPYLLDALTVLQQQLDEWQRAMSPCKVHGPDLWEGDGTCVPCEGQRLRDERDALQQQLDAVVLHRDDALRRLDALRAAREAHRCSGCGLRWAEHGGAELCGDCWRKAQCHVLPAAAPEKGGQ